MKKSLETKNINAFFNLMQWYCPYTDIKKMKYKRLFIENGRIEKFLPISYADDLEVCGVFHEFKSDNKVHRVGFFSLKLDEKKIPDYYNYFYFFIDDNLFGDNQNNLTLKFTKDWFRRKLEIHSDNGDFVFDYSWPFWRDFIYGFYNDPFLYDSKDFFSQLMVMVKGCRSVWLT